MASSLSGSPDEAALVQAASLQPLAVSELPYGEMLSFPLKDQHGNVLLDEAQPITPKFFENARRNRVDTVWLHQHDVESLFGTIARVAPPSAAPIVAEQSGVASQLDRKLLDPKACELVQTGPEFKESMTEKGAVPYEPKLVNDVVKLQQEASVQVNDLLEGLSSIRGAQKSELAAGNVVAYSIMEMMRRDLDLVIGTRAAFKEENYLVKHSVSLATLSMAVAAEMHYDERNVLLTGLTGLVHDAGMLRVPDAIRNAPRKLTPGEYVEVMKHVVYTAEMLDKAQGLPVVLRVSAYQVHERYNGDGYLRRKVKNQIHPFARIVGVVDTFLALTSERPYRRPFLPYNAMFELLQNTGKGWYDPDAVRALLHVMSLFPIGSHVLLNDDRAGRVIRSNRAQYDKPVIEVLYDSDGKSIPPVIVDLATETSLKVTQAIRIPSAPPANPNPAAN